jgi:hypothetical protein
MVGKRPMPVSGRLKRLFEKRCSNTSFTKISNSSNVHMNISGSTIREVWKIVCRLRRRIRHQDRISIRCAKNGLLMRFLIRTMKMVIENCTALKTGKTKDMKF